ncbi:MAG: DUF359 domain-containing protein [Desulfurococcales archaeon]|nr:DUF359 domain-containing protein [Desulfurococcales archaeon]
MIPSLKLPDKLRKDFQAIRGEVYRGDFTPLLSGLSPNGISCIGDIVSRYCIQLQESAMLLVIDGKTRRTSRIDEDPLVRMAVERGYRVRRVVNPPGGITYEAIEVVCSAIENRVNSLILVEGEEDMLALPAIACTRPGGLVIYGIPGIGATLVKVNLLVSREAQTRFLELRPGI